MEAIQQIGAYRVVSELGRGGQGVVYLAEDTRLKRRVALKVLRGIATLAPETLERFLRESAVAARLDHRGICPVYDAGVEGDLAYIAMRFVAGRSLARLIDEARGFDGDATFSFVDVLSQLGGEEAGSGGLEDERSTTSVPSSRGDLERILEIFEKAARALEVAHAAGIVHRDIKPANIMLGAREQPVILDFGLSRDEESDGVGLTQSGDLFGTPAYMSPEQVAPQGLRIDARTDVYSLGVSLYECLTLRRPFEAPTRMALFDAIRHDDPPRPRALNRAIPRDLEVVLLTAMERDRGRRYQSAADFAEELRRVRELQPILARPAGPLVRFQRWVQRDPVLAALAGLLVLALVGGLVIALVLLGQRGEALRETEAARSAVERERDDADLVADVTRLNVLLDQAREELWPATPERGPALREWLGRARRLLARRPRHEAAIVAAEEAEEAESSGSGVDDWKLAMMRRFLERLDAFAAGEVGPHETVASVEARLRFAETVREASLIRPQREWEEAIAAIAAHPLYGGMRLEPQLGLVPLGADPGSGLWEFAHLESGAVARRDPESGRLRLSAESGLVLVLLPPGIATIGAQSASPERPHYDPSARDNEAPVHAVRLEAFFLSKYEMTQAQWERLAGTNPSQFRAGSTLSGVAFTALHPVERVSWGGAAELARKLGLELPTEVQWEYACRAGTETPYACGADAACLQGFANVADRSFVGGHAQGAAHDDFLEDGHPFPAPVGSFAPNPWGLCDLHGNVWEWCADRFLPYAHAVREGSGAREGRDARDIFRILRGGGYDQVGAFARSAFRSGDRPDVQNHANGFRPARGVEGR